MKKLFTAVAQNKLCSFLLLLSTLLFCLFLRNVFQSQILKDNLLYKYQIIPDIALKNSLLYETTNSIQILGFVQFLDADDQPNLDEARQYYSIQSADVTLSPEIYFTVTEFLKLPYIPLTTLGSEVIVGEILGNTIHIKTDGVTFVMYKNGSVILLEQNKPIATLITDEEKYRNHAMEYYR